MGKQTAIQELIQEMESLLNSKTYINPKNALNDCIQLAYNKLAMEREMIKEAMGVQAEKYSTPYINEDGQPAISFDIDDSFNDYFTETYGGNNG